jgi:hypothetical protein
MLPVPILIPPPGGGPGPFKKARLNDTNTFFLVAVREEYDELFDEDRSLNLLVVGVLVVSACRRWTTEGPPDPAILAQMYEMRYGWRRKTSEAVPYDTPVGLTVVNSCRFETPLPATAADVKNGSSTHGLASRVRRCTLKPDSRQLDMKPAKDKDWRVTWWPSSGCRIYGYREYHYMFSILCCNFGENSSMQDTRTATHTLR